MGTADVKSIREEFQAEWGDVRQKIENYSEESNEDLSKLIDKKNKWEGQYEQLNQIRQHEMNQHVAKDEGDINKVEPYPTGQAIKKLYGAKKEALNDLEHLVNAGKDQKIIDEARAGVNVITGKISALKAVQDANQSNQRNTERKQARSLSPNIQTTKTNTKTKSNNSIMGTQQKIYNKGEKIYQGGGEISASEALSAYLTKPKNENQRKAIQNNLTSQGIELTDHLFKEVIDMYRPLNALMNAGAKIVMAEGKGDKQKYVTLEDNIGGGYYDELEEASLSDANVFSTAEIDLKTYRFNIQLSREVTADSLNIGDAVLTAATGSISDSMVKGSFVSQGANAPVGLNDLITQTETFPVDGNASIMNLVNASKQLYDNNVPGEKQSAILSPSAWQAMQLESDDNSRYQHQPPAVDNMPKFVSSGVPAGEAYVGDFSSVLFGLGSSLILENYSGVSARKFAVEMLAAMRWDITVLRPKGLVRIEQAST